MNRYPPVCKQFKFTDHTVQQTRAHICDSIKRQVCLIIHDMIDIFYSVLSMIYFLLSAKSTEHREGWYSRSFYRPRKLSYEGKFVA